MACGWVPSTLLIIGQALGSLVRPTLRPILRNGLRWPSLTAMTYPLLRRLAHFAALALLLVWIEVTSIDIIAGQFALLPTDGCGQILDLPRLEAYELRFRMLNVLLWTCLFAETVLPRLRTPAWSLVLILIVGTLLIGSNLAISDARFLSECDTFMIGPDTSVNFNVFNAVLLAVVTWVRFRSPRVTSSAS